MMEALTLQSSVGLRCVSGCEVDSQRDGERRRCAKDTEPSVCVRKESVCVHFLQIQLHKHAVSREHCSDGNRSQFKITSVCLKNNSGTKNVEYIVRARCKEKGQKEFLPPLPGCAWRPGSGPFPLSVSTSVLSVFAHCL